MALPCFPPQQKGVALTQRLEDIGADVVMPVRMGPAAIVESAVGIFVRSPWRLHHAVERNKFSNDKLSHDLPLLLICRSCHSMSEWRGSSRLCYQTYAISSSAIRSFL